jgi:hypothetical protein
MIPADFQEKLLNLQICGSQLRKKLDYAFKHIRNANDTAVYFGKPKNHVSVAKGEKKS